MTKGYAKLKKDLLALRRLHTFVVDERDRVRKRNEELVCETTRLQRELSEEKSRDQFEYHQQVHLANDLRAQMDRLSNKLDLSQKALYTLIEKMT